MRKMRFLENTLVTWYKPLHSLC